MNKAIKRGGLSILAVAVIAYASNLIVGNGSNNKETTSKQIMVEVEEKMENEIDRKIETFFPSYNENKQYLTLIGTVISHETANIYPRRSGIVKDLYVDIGDAIKAGETIGLMLPPGVEGQSNAAIYEKQVKVEEAKSNLSTTKLTAQEKVQEAINNLKNTQLTAAEKIRQAELNVQLVDVRDGALTINNEMIRSLQTDKENINEQLRVMLESHKRVSQGLVDDMEQLLEQSDIMYISMIEMMEHIFLGEEHNNSDLRNQDINDGLGARDPTALRDAKFSYRQLVNNLVLYQENSKQGDRDQRIQARLNFADEVTATVVTMRYMLDYSLNVDGLTQDSLNTKEQNLLEAQSKLAMNKEKLIDLLNKMAITHAMQEGEVTSMKTMLATIDSKLEVQGAKIKTEIETNEQKLALIKAEQGSMIQSKEDMLDLAHVTQQAMIQSKQNMINIASSQLNREYAVSSNQYIISPFDGIVSKRMANVGSVVSMSMPLYELVNVPTSLAKLAKREVQFGLPEEYANLLEKDTSITYTLPNDQTTKHKAIITRISPQVDEMTRTITVQAKIADDMNIPHQTRVDVHLPLTDATFYQVPTSSLVYSGDVVYVVVVDSDENILLKEVSVMADDGEYADIQGSIDSTTALAKNYRQAKKIVEERIKREGIILKENQEETNREDTP